MTMAKPKTSIATVYDQVAEKYARQFKDELQDKPLDRLLLQAFAKDNKEKGILIDLGCGPGQTTRFLKDAGQTDITGLDLSSEMINQAIKLHPDIHFQTGDLLNLDLPENTYGSAIAFYSIVHFSPDQLTPVFRQVQQILKPNAQFLLSFHCGDTSVHLDEWFEEKVDIDFYMFHPDQIIQSLKDAGFEIIDALVRYPYTREHQTKRAYIKCQKT
jgi:ubiquinone/menaquinone biosynthesis C-methylase UbiE